MAIRPDDHLQSFTSRLRFAVLFRVSNLLLCKPEYSALELPALLVCMN